MYFNFVDSNGNSLKSDFESGASKLTLGATIHGCTITYQPTIDGFAFELVKGSILIELIVEKIIR